MATYKVIQDIEAEDKFLGPLTLKQFIFGAAGVFFGYLGFFAVSQGAAFLLVLFIPPMLLGFFLAFPWSKEQPTELWVIAKLRFKLKPRIRIWNQAGLEELVTITVPKKLEKHLTNGLDQDEVESRLKALASTIDSRGWAIKNATLPQAYNTPQPTERLINPAAAFPQEVPDVDINAFPDVLDDNTSVSNNFSHMIADSTQQRRQQSLDKMDRIRHGATIASLEQPQIQFTPPAAPAQFNEQMLSEQLRTQRAQASIANENMRTVPISAPSQPVTTPVATQTPAPQPVITQPAQPQAAMTPAVKPDILELAQNNDLNVATIAREASRSGPDNGGEVVVSLR